LQDFGLILYTVLERRVAGQDARERAEADVVGRAVAANGDHGRQKRQFFLGEQVPRQEAELRIVLLGHIGIVQFETGQAHGAHILHVLRRNTFENALGQRLGILEQAVDPRIVVGVEREGRGINAAAPRGIGDDRAFFAPPAASAGAHRPARQTRFRWSGFVPARSVVIPGSYTKKFPAGDFQVPCALIIGQRKASTDLKTSLNDALRDYSVAV